MNKKDPEIIIFACEWTPYIGADNAGVEMQQYSPFVRIIRVICTGQITPSNILTAFKNGADGVMIAGCEEGDCHYIVGNEKCIKVVEETKQLLKFSGIEPERLEIKLFTEVDGSTFASIVNKFVMKIRKMGKVQTEVSS
ncbi:hydrogenase iron-sulfur subunit [candidate division KSB1 bacterium]|nr:MAG: hydrogenase iron-sulfur subunit [candidate division KSB1 bacterium]